MKDHAGLLTMMERAAFTSTKVRNTKTEKDNMVIFATSNSTERLSKLMTIIDNFRCCPEFPKHIEIKPKGYLGNKKLERNK
jgi:hypothetical protein